jgi:hypothetical protein
MRANVDIHHRARRDARFVPPRPSQPRRTSHVDPASTIEDMAAAVRHGVPMRTSEGICHRAPPGPLARQFARFVPPRPSQPRRTGCLDPAEVIEDVAGGAQDEPTLVTRIGNRAHRPSPGPQLARCAPAHPIEAHTSHVSPTGVVEDVAATTRDRMVA